MEIDLYYNKQIVKYDIPPDIHLDLFYPDKIESTVSFDDFKLLIEKSDVLNFLSTGSILFIVNDAHRTTPTSLILDWFNKINPEIIENATFLVACGTHEKPDEEQYRKIFCEYYDSLKERIFYHDCHNYDRMVNIGKDKFGEEVWLNKSFFEFDRVFIINSVEPHYFAGFTGGRKSFFPGLADFKTVERNHNLANSLDCAPMKLSGNPLAEHLDNMLNLIDISKVRTAQLVYSHQKTITMLHDIQVGNIKDAFATAVVTAKKVYLQQVTEKYDTILLEILPPLDKSLYQVQKALENSQAVVKDGGSVIIISVCNEGVGSEHFYQLAENWDRNTNKSKDGKLHFGSHKLSRVNAIGQRINVYLYSNLSGETVSKVYYRPLKDIQKYIMEDSLKKENYRLALVHDAAHTVLTM